MDAMVDKTQSLKISPNSVVRNDCRCGIKPQMRITNSDLAPVAHWPWFVVISKQNKNGDWRQMCGATLIDDRHAVSAAHCFITEDYISGIGYVIPDDYKFYLNFYKKGKDQDVMEDVIIRRASWIRCHEKYVQRKRGLYNDLCLIEFDHAVQCNDKTRPICLASHLPDFAKKCLVAGFGDQSGAGDYPATLRQGVLSIQDHTTCQSIYGSKDTEINESFFCAANVTNGIDTCQGDSGGPLTCSEDGIDYLYGITSFGVGCNDQKYPGAYTDVSHYTEWLETTKSYRPCENAPTDCGAVITEAPGVLTVQLDNDGKHYLNNQVGIFLNYPKLIDCQNFSSNFC